jgi:thiamine pyrophosphate-dependent acetolactate synthase large subunit-like protein
LARETATSPFSSGWRSESSTCGSNSGLAGLGAHAAAGQRAAFDFAGDGGNHRHFQEFGRRQRRIGVENIRV